MLVAPKLHFKLCKFLHHFIRLFFIIEIEFTQKELLMGLIMAQKSYIIGRVAMNHFIILHEVGSTVFGTARPHLNFIKSIFILSNKLFTFFLPLLMSYFLIRDRNRHFFFAYSNN